MVEVHLAPSVRLRACIGLAAAATLAALAATPLPIAATILAVTFTLCAALYALHDANRGRHICVEHGGAVSVDGRAGALRAGSFVAPWLAILRWRPAGSWFDHTVVVLPGMLPPAAFRELRVILIWGQTT